MNNWMLVYFEMSSALDTKPSKVEYFKDEAAARKKAEEDTIQQGIEDANIDHIAVVKIVDNYYPGD